MYEGVEVSIEDLPSTPYWNYYFGDPAYNENYYVQNEKGKILPEYYCDDIEEILSMVEEGMDLKNFFRGTIFAGFTEEVLQQMLDEGSALNYLVFHSRTPGHDGHGQLVIHLSDVDTQVCACRNHSVDRLKKHNGKILISYT